MSAEYVTQWREPTTPTAQAGPTAGVADQLPVSQWWEPVSPAALAGEPEAPAGEDVHAAQWDEPRGAPSILDVVLVRYAGVWRTTEDLARESGYEAVGAYRYVGGVLTIVEEAAHEVRVSVRGERDVYLYGPQLGGVPVPLYPVQDADGLWMWSAEGPAGAGVVTGTDGLLALDVGATSTWTATGIPGGGPQLTQP